MSELTYGHWMLFFTPTYLVGAVVGLYLYIMDPGRRRLEFFFAAQCMGMALHSLLAFLVATPLSEPERVRYIVWIYQSSLLYTLSFFHFLAIALKMNRNRWLTTMDVVLAASFLLNLTGNHLVIPDLFTIQIDHALGRYIGHTLKPNFIGVAVMALAIGTAAWLVYRLAEDMLRRGRKSLWPLFVGSLLFGLAIVNDVLITNGVFEGFFLAAVAFVMLTLGMLIYLINQGVRWRVRIESQKSQLEDLNRAQTEFFNVAGHELETPITTLIGYLDMINEERLGTLPEPIRAPLNRMGISVRRLQRLTQSILDVGRLQKQTLNIQRRPVDIRAIAGEVHEETLGFWTAMNQQVELNADSDLPLVLGDPYRVRQILFNLLSNASKYTPPGGRIVMNLAAQGGGVAVEIADSSPGLEDRDLRHLFDPFYIVGGSQHHTSHQDDTCGLGLYIAKQLVELQGGSISVRSRKGQGTIYRLAFPQSRQPLAS